MKRSGLRWRDVLHPGTGIVPAFALLLAGIAKTHDPFPAAQFIARAVGGTLETGFLLARATAGLELAVGALLCITLGRSKMIPCLGLCLFAFFAGLSVSVYRADPAQAACGCFGGLFNSFLQRSPRAQVALDVGLGASLALHAVLTRPAHACPGSGAWRRAALAGRPAGARPA